jgi:poly(ADP-ribose) glycohydrolase
VTFKRKVLTNPPKWEDSVELLCHLDVRESGTIEESIGMCQVDFANKTIGGGVLGKGCVQEEIRFAISTECIASRLIMEEMDERESIIIIGSQVFSKYKGYGDTFTFDGPFEDKTEMSEYFIIEIFVVMRRED